MPEHNWRAKFGIIYILASYYICRDIKPLRFIHTQSLPGIFFT